MNLSHLPIVVEFPVGTGIYRAEPKEAEVHQGVPCRYRDIPFKAFPVPAGIKSSL